MKTRRLIAFVGSLVAIGAVACVVLARYRHLHQPALRDPSKLVAAVQAFSRDHVAHGLALPSSVSVSELVRGGYIVADDVRAFEGMEVTISFTADETRPQDILVRARLPDGSVIAALADGSVHQLAR